MCELFGARSFGIKNFSTFTALFNFQEAKLESKFRVKSMTLFFPFQNFVGARVIVCFSAYFGKVRHRQAKKESALSQNLNM